MPLVLVRKPFQEVGRAGSSAFRVESIMAKKSTRMSAPRSTNIVCRFYEVFVDAPPRIIYRRTKQHRFELYRTKQVYPLEKEGNREHKRSVANFCHRYEQHSIFAVFLRPDNCMAFSIAC